MKRFISFVLALTMTLTLCACGSGSGQLSPYLLGLRFGANEEETDRAILDLEKNDDVVTADSILVNGIAFTEINPAYSDGYLSGIRYAATNDSTIIGLTVTSKSNPDFDIDTSAVETTVSDLVGKYNQAYAILVKSFGKPDKGNAVELTLPQDELSNPYHNVSALWNYRGHTIILEAESDVETYPDPIPGYDQIAYYCFLVTELSLSIQDSLE